MQRQDTGHPTGSVPSLGSGLGPQGQAPAPCHLSRPAPTLPCPGADALPLLRGSQTKAGLRQQLGSTDTLLHVTFSGRLRETGSSQSKQHNASLQEPLIDQLTD